MLSAGRDEQFRLSCHKLLETGDVGAVKVALILPVSGADFERACQLATAQVKNAIPNSCMCREHINEALAEYHRGHFEAADDWAKRVSPAIGAEAHLLSLGMIFSGTPGLKARVKLTALLSAGLAREEIRDLFHAEWQ